MSWKGRILLGGVLMVLIAISLVAVLKIDLAPDTAPGAKRVERTRQLSEGLKLSRHGLYGIDLVSIGVARMRKLRKGPFAIGAVNELVLEDVSLVLPEELWGATGRDVAAETMEKGPREMLARLGVDAGSLKFGEKVPRFSALLIRDLRVARLVGTNAVPWFVAKRAVAQRDGLSLEEGYSVEQGQTNAWGKARLLCESDLRLVPLASGGNA